MSYLMPIEMRAAAADVFAFDAMIQNPDRRNDNPNAKVRDDVLGHLANFKTHLPGTITQIQRALG